MWIPCTASADLSDWKRPSPRICTIRNPRLAYSFRISVMHLKMTSSDCRSICFTVVNLMWCDSDTRKGSPFTNMVSIDSVTARYLSMIVIGMLPETGTINFPFFHTVLPLIDPMSGPKMASAFRTSSAVTGQLGINRFSSISIRCLVLGRPIFFCNVLAVTAHE